MREGAMKSSVVCVIAIACLLTGCAKLRESLTGGLSGNGNTEFGLTDSDMQTVYMPDFGNIRGRREHVLVVHQPLPERPGVSSRVLAACRDMIEAAAKPQGAVRVEAASAGLQRYIRGGMIEAPIMIRILYRDGADWEIRQATIACRVDRRYQPVATPVLSM
jgi:hypothetical protein